MFCPIEKFTRAVNRIFLKNLEDRGSGWLERRERGNPRHQSVLTGRVFWGHCNRYKIQNNHHTVCFNSVGIPGGVLMKKILTNYVIHNGSVTACIHVGGQNSVDHPRLLVLQNLNVMNGDNHFRCVIVLIFHRTDNGGGSRQRRDSPVSDKYWHGINDGTGCGR